MKKLFIFAMVISLSILLASFVNASVGVSCTYPGVNMGQNPEATIALCDDPNDSTCEQSFETLCPQDWHLCTPTEYNMGNDNWAGNVPTWLLGDITCRAGSGAGHYTLWDTGTAFSIDVPYNQHAGSSLSECSSEYGCNEQQYYALCCYGSSGGNDGGSDEEPDDTPVDIPEFGAIAGGIALIGALGIFAFNRRK